MGTQQSSPRGDTQPPRWRRSTSDGGAKRKHVPSSSPRSTDLLCERQSLQSHRRQRDEISILSQSDSDHGESRLSPASFQDPLRNNLMMLPSAIDPLGRKIRRVTADIVDDDEQLLLVKRRANAAKAIALHVASPGNNTHADDDPQEELAVQSPPMTPQDFEYLKVIGVGGMGRVVLVRNRRDGKLYAMKVVSKSSVREHGLSDKVLSERDVLGGTHHHSLVHLHWAFQTRRSLFLVMDYCPGGELSNHLQSAERFSEDVARFYACELVQALEHLHRHGIIYRDLKPENILLTEDGHLKLVDFGLSKFGITEATAGAKTICGSYEYLAPEVFRETGYGSAVDWWSFGAVLYEMMTGLPPWYHENRHTMRKRVLTKPLTFPTYIGDDAKDLLRRLLTLNPAERLGSADDGNEVRRHRFFRNVDWQMVTFQEVFPPIQPCEHEDAIEDATNFDIEFTRLSIGSVESSSGVCDEFKGFNFEPPPPPLIEYGYSRDFHAYGHSGLCA